MKYKNEYSVAVVGATGNTGMQTLQILAERNFPSKNVIAIASPKSSGKSVSFGNTTLRVQQITDVDFSKVDMAFFCAGSSVSCKSADLVTKSGCVIIDKTSYFRLNPKVPLIIPEVNADVLKKGGAPLGIVSTPNCVAVPLALTFKALSKLSPLKRAVVSTYQSVSGAGRRAIDELYNQSKAIMSADTSQSDVFAKQIAFNVIPLIGNTYASGVSEEEDKISCEIRKILGAGMQIAVTCVRVPVFIGHSMSVACEFTKSFCEEDIYDALEYTEGVVVVDRKNESAEFVTPLDTQGEDAVYVSRIRKDTTVKNGLLYWVATDNLRKGAALNSVQIAETMISMDPKLKKFKKVIS
ncbi:MAG: aspartate-semialdehyde dehydrogenase [Holosporaceae bacterium]|jgi:aspartate-semialdehyde dehydrogenase|nr:aspartate-semialdehyde dehydrogenase [Holosporaceae bacterium]